MKLPASELVPRISQFCLKEWQDIWNCCVNNKLHDVYPCVGSARTDRCVLCHEAVVINRLKIVTPAWHSPTCFQEKTNHRVHYVTHYSQWSIYLWNVQTCRIPATNTFLSLVWETCLKALTVVSLLILSKTPIFITLYNICYFLFISAFQPWFYI